MCRKLVFLIAVLGLVSTAWAVDLNPPPWRGEPGSLMSHWTYDEDAPPGYGVLPDTAPQYPRVDAADVESFVPHPHKTDPGDYIDRAYAEGWIWDTYWEPGGWVPAGELYPGADYSKAGMQLWAGGSDIWIGPGPDDYAYPPPTWNASYGGRTGVLSDFAMGSWDVFNFSSDPPQPEKHIWVQLTWMPEDPTEPVTWEYELEAFTDAPMIEATWIEEAGWVFDNYFDEYEGPLSEAPPSFDEWERWWEPAYWEEGAWQNGGWIGWGQAWFEEVFWAEAGWNFEEIYDAFYGGELVPFEDIDLGDGWTLSKFLIVADIFNPDVEFLGLFPSLPIALDQIVIDTICIPEPITISLLGLGGLLLIRRRKR